MCCLQATIWRLGEGDVVKLLPGKSKPLNAHEAIVVVNSVYKGGVGTRVNNILAATQAASDGVGVTARDQSVVLLELMQLRWPLDCIEPKK